MKVPLSWLADYVDLPTTDPHELGSVLDGLGHEVEGIEILEPSFDGVVVGRVVTVGPHPAADKVRLTTVDTGDGPVEIVCGAWNFDAGAVVAVARPGATLMGGEFTITERTIRGVVSHGMICSAKELGLGQDTDGILVLDDDLEIGSDFAAHVALPDAVIDLSITPNRPDAMAMIGVARELAAHYGVPWRMPAIEEVPGTGTSALSIVIDDDRCRRFTGREVAGVTVGPSPLWMQLRLARAGQRPISNVVDVSNYVMLELGQPTHAFDMDTVPGGSVIVRAARDGERLTTLDGVDRALTPSDLVVADENAASSLAGTMGGESSEVSESTTRVLVEVASWDPPTILHMSRRHGLRSEASARFERGVDPLIPPAANHRMVHLLSLTAGGVPVGDLVDVDPAPFVPLEIDLPVALIDRTLGVAVDGTEAVGLLARLGIEAHLSGDVVRAVAPSFRPDLGRPIDLVEEIARMLGYETFEPTIPAGPGGGLTDGQRRERLLRAGLTGLGLSEALSFSFHGHRALADLGLAPDDHRRRAIEVRNPLREEESLLRTTLLPGLLDAASFNVHHGTADVALFEIGRVFLDEASPELGVVPDQPVRLGIVLVGTFGQRGVGTTARAIDAHTVVGLVEALLSSLGHASTIDQRDIPPLHPGRGALLSIGGTEIGFAGEVHPKVARAWDLPGRVAVAELDLEAVLADPGAWLFSEPSLMPPVDFDLAFVVPNDVATGRVEAVVRNAGAALVERVRPFDVYTGTGVPDGHRSLAVRVRLRAGDRTLTNEEAGEVRARMIDGVAELGGTLRGAS